MNTIDYILIALVIALVMIACVRALFAHVDTMVPTTASQAKPSIEGAPITDATGNSTAH